MPGRPLTAPRNANTNRTAVNIEYDAVSDHGGSPITHYNIYIDDGSGGAFSSPINNGLSLTYSSQSLGLTTGRYYRIKYAAYNVLGESIHSDYVLILMAELPLPPASISRVTTGKAGSIQVSWTAPSDDGGTPIRGYQLKLDGVLKYDGRNSAGITGHTLDNLSLGKDYLIEVFSVNILGLSETPASLTTSAGSVPNRPSRV